MGRRAADPARGTTMNLKPKEVRVNPMEREARARVVVELQPEQVEVLPYVGPV
jgi:hypothetical protein